MSKPTIAPTEVVNDCNLLTEFQQIEKKHQIAYVRNLSSLARKGGAFKRFIRVEKQSAQMIRLGLSKIQENVRC